MSCLCIIFAKEPVPGQVKTRLTPPLSAGAACRLYQAFLEDILEETGRISSVSPALAFAPAGAAKFFRDLAPGVPQFPQEGRDLGARMARAFAWGAAAGYRNLLIRGSDTPDLPGAVILRAREILAAGVAQVVLGPSPDGGYYLVGLRDLHPELFAGISWSSRGVLAETIRRARELSLKVQLLAGWRDIDDYADLAAFLSEPHPAPRPGWRSDRLGRELLAGLDFSGRSGAPPPKNAATAKEKDNNDLTADPEGRQ